MSSYHLPKSAVLLSTFFFLLIGGTTTSAQLGTIASVHQGFGATTPGGAGGRTVSVTNLNDSGLGSLRDALSQGNRNIAFLVRGTILLKSPLDVKGANITISALNVPSPGITIRNYGLRIRGNRGAHDVIVAGLRIRDAKEDGIQIAWEAYNVLVTNVSVDNSGDGNIDISHGAHDVTVAWSILGRTKENKNMLIKTTIHEVSHETNRITLHHNLFTKSAFRNPRISNFEDGTPATDITTDMRNNLVWNWGAGAGTDVECGAVANLVNNFYASPSSSAGNKQQAITVREEDFQAGCGGLAYVAGNISGDGLSMQINAESTEPAPFIAPFVATTDACTAARAVLAGAGVRPLDAIDVQHVSAISLVCSGTSGTVGTGTGTTQPIQPVSQSAPSNPPQPSSNLWWLGLSSQR